MNNSLCPEHFFDCRSQVVHVTGNVDVSLRGSRSGVTGQLSDGFQFDAAEDGIRAIEVPQTVSAAVSWQAQSFPQTLHSGCQVVTSPRSARVVDEDAEAIRLGPTNPNQQTNQDGVQDDDSWAPCLPGGLMLGKHHTTARQVHVLPFDGRHFARTAAAQPQEEKYTAIARIGRAEDLTPFCLAHRSSRLAWLMGDRWEWVLVDQTKPNSPAERALNGPDDTEASPIGFPSGVLADPENQIGGPKGGNVMLAEALTEPRQQPGIFAMGARGLSYLGEVAADDFGNFGASGLRAVMAERQACHIVWPPLFLGQRKAISSRPGHTGRDIHIRLVTVGCQTVFVEVMA